VLSALFPEEFNWLLDGIALQISLPLSSNFDFQFLSANSFPKVRKFPKNRAWKLNFLKNNNTTILK
jgi:hypothetical protein